MRADGDIEWDHEAWLEERRLLAVVLEWAEAGAPTPLDEVLALPAPAPE